MCCSVEKLQSLVEKDLPRQTASRTLDVLGRARRSQDVLVLWLAVSDTARLCEYSLEPLGLHDEVSVSSEFCRVAGKHELIGPTLTKKYLGSSASCGNGADVRSTQVLVGLAVGLVLSLVLWQNFKKKQAPQNISLWPIDCEAVPHICA